MLKKVIATKLKVVSMKAGLELGKAPDG